MLSHFVGQSVLKAERQPDPGIQYGQSSGGQDAARRTFFTIPVNRYSANSGGLSYHSSARAASPSLGCPRGCLSPFQLAATTFGLFKGSGGENLTWIRMFSGFMPRDQHMESTMSYKVDFYLEIIDQARKVRHKFLFVFLFNLTTVFLLAVRL